MTHRPSSPLRRLGITSSATRGRAFILTLALLGAVLLLLVVTVFSRFSPLLRTQLSSLPELVFRGILKTDTLVEGAHELLVSTRTQSGQQATARIPFTLQRPVPTPVVPPPPPSAVGETPVPTTPVVPPPPVVALAPVPPPTPASTGGGDGGGTSGGGGGAPSGDGGGGGEDRATPAPPSEQLPRRTVRLHEGEAGEETTLATYVEEDSPKGYSVAAGGFALQGNPAYASLRHTERNDAAAEVSALLPHDKVTLERTLSLSKGTYLISIRGRTRGPGSSLVKVEVGGRSVGTVTLSPTTYATEVVGVFSHDGGPVKVAERFINDLFTCKPKDLAANQTAHCNRDALVSRISVTRISGVSKRPLVKTAPSAGPLVTRINEVFRSVYSRTPTTSEHAYWLSRVVSGEKTTAAALTGTMRFHRILRIRH